MTGSDTGASRVVADAEQLRILLGQDFTFSDEQFAAITAPLEPGVIVAGAGSGKTAVMAARVVWLVATGQVRPAEVLGLTFTTKATHELDQRIRASLRAAGLLPEPGPRPDPRERPAGEPDEPEEPEEPEEPTVSTYHAYAAGLLTDYGLRIGHEPDTRLLADASRYQLAARAIARYIRPVDLLTDHPATAITNLLALDAAMTEHLVDPDEVRAYDAAQRALFVTGMDGEARKTYLDRNLLALSAIDRRAELLDLIDDYRALKAGLGLMDFSDQIALAARLARDCPDVGEAERARFKVVLLDEYQDTSVAQAMMLGRLFSGEPGRGGRGHPVTAVGDPNQAIYGWRGASVSNILRFAEDFPGSAGRATTYPLTVNRRSDRRILAAANHLAADLYATTASVAPLQPEGEAGDGVVRVAVHETYDEELTWLAVQVRATWEARSPRAWNEIGVLTRDNAHAADVYDVLTRAEIPVEIVGLKGLLRLPEVAEVVAMLTLLEDVTANAALLTVLTGPRWAVGARDLAALGRRARDLARGHAPVRAAQTTVHEDLQAAVAGADLTEVASLCDALEEPGDLDYSPQARERFALLASELRRLRAAVGEPLLDLVRRIIDSIGIDVELASSVNPAAPARRDNLDLFVHAVAEFQAVDGAITLAALLAWLEAEDEFGNGLDVATPTEADSVKLLTVHRAKGLEWDAVFLVGVAERKFPTNRSRSQWVTVPFVLPTDLRGDRADLPALGGHRSEDLQQLKDAVKVYEQIEELRLGYVAWTRARHQLVVSSYCWSPTNKTPTGPSAYQARTREALSTWGEDAELWRDKPDKTVPHPYAGQDGGLTWPIAHGSAEVERRLEAARRVRVAEAEGADWSPGDDDGLDVLEATRVAEWDQEMESLLTEARRDRSTDVQVPLPSSLSATSLARLRDDPEAFAAELARPMPRRPSPSARFGTRFHAWVETRFGQQLLLDPDDLPGRGDAEIDDDDDLRALVVAFEEGQFAERVPAAVEPPFALVLAGQVVRGRIDAVYDDSVAQGGVDGGYLVVDWKTNRTQSADPVQLAIYRVAWAELHGLALDQVRAAFYYVRTGDLVEHTGLEDRAGLERMLREEA